MSVVVEAATSVRDDVGDEVEARGPAREVSED